MATLSETVASVFKIYDRLCSALEQQSHTFFNLTVELKKEVEQLEAENASLKAQIDELEENGS